MALSKNKSKKNPGEKKETQKEQTTDKAIEVRVEELVENNANQVQIGSYQKYIRNLMKRNK